MNILWCEDSVGVAFKGKHYSYVFEILLSKLCSNGPGVQSLFLAKTKTKNTEYFQHFWRFEGI